MVTSTIQSGRKASSVRKFFLELFNLGVKSEGYTVAVMDGSAFGECLKTFTVKSKDGPAVLALNLLKENRELDGKRLWISDPNLGNMFPHRFRLKIDSDGNPRATMIEPRRR
jgi:hypothetical protein